MVWRLPAPLVGTAVFVGLLPASAIAAGWAGQAAFEVQHFLEERTDSLQAERNVSVAVSPEYEGTWDSGGRAFRFEAFLRLDENDDQRTHADVRELSWTRVGEWWEARIGVRTVFWGVTEAVHLVDIINQTDFVENIDGEDKLGQPMVNLALVGEGGSLDFFWLPVFRERTFPGREGRPRNVPYVDNDLARYASKSDTDWAARLSGTRGPWDYGLSYFSGTGRQPRLVYRVTAEGPVLVPVYSKIAQTGVDLQATLGAWLWKFEGIYRETMEDDFFASDFGFEHAIGALPGTRADLSLIAEYLYNDQAAGSSPFEDDIVIGARLALNNTASTNVLATMTFDRDTSARFYNLEASHRLGQIWKATLEARTFSGIPTDDPLFGFRHDDYLQVELISHF